MRPGRILLFLLAVVLTLFILSLAINKSRSVSGTLFYDEEQSMAGHDTVASDSPVSDTAHPHLSSSVTPTAPGLSPSVQFTPPVLSASVPPPSDSLNAGRDKDVDSPPYFPGEAIRDSLAKGQQVRILFYGDSQVEGDRETSLLRRKLREVGGGTGPGMFSPVMPVMYTRSYVVRSSTNWKRYTLLDYRNGTLSHNRLGPMLALCRFTPPDEQLTTRSFATVRINPVPDADVAVSTYDKLRIFYGNNYDTVLVGIRSGSTLVDFAMLQLGEGPLEYAVPLPSVSDVTVEFTGRNSPDIYAMSLESDAGVIIDNVPVRGSAGLEFVMTDIKGFDGILPKLNPDVIFLQFGLNVVRNVRNEYHYYEEGLVKQIEFLKRASGGVPIVLVSVTDMALRVNDTIRRFPNIRAIRDAQENAAARSGVIFWDAWESMGGTGSITNWFDHRPALASKDLTHLSNAGADTIASRIHSALLATSTARQKTTGEVPAVAGTLPLSETAPAVTATDTAAQPPQETVMAESDAGGNADNNVEGGGWLASLLKHHPDQAFIFTTAGFWIFFLVVMAGFAAMHKKRSMCHTWLLMVSLYFYYRVGGLFIILLATVTLLTYLTALTTGKASRKAGKRFWLVTNILILLGFLSYFKYAGFFTTTVNSIFNTSFVAHDIFSAWSNGLFGTAFDVNSIVLPVGISFFTFQALSYSIDVYRGRMSPVKNFIDFSFYLTFFPQLVAGPIVRASEFMPQMKGEYSISRNEFGHGLFLILQGLVKKMLISDVISSGFIDRVFDTPALFSGFENLMAVYGYGLQIYCDFSGYTDIAIGVALLMGFRLPLNFNSPYKAANVGEFWKRWHISLSRWLKDYLYIPLGGSRKGPVRTGINLMITMLIGGLWHGAATRFVVWGGLHGVALVADKIWRWLFRKVTRKTRAARIAGIILTFNFVSFAWIFFRAETMQQAGMMLTQIFSSFNPGNYGRVVMAYLPVIVLILSGYIMHFLSVPVKEAYRGLFIRLPLAVKFLIAVIVIMLLYKVGTDVVQPFIYFRF
ncbi:MAG: MBOAT family O-acyltransferase [Bacteroidales bacterium]|jgi:D-alanyl-lipoteichoic acid acyltransferase DltB (MBOAT superfamily)|nr:MBOAT family O-acyltransferase [Bacteroidales bacterium]